MSVSSLAPPVLSSPSAAHSKEFDLLCSCAAVELSPEQVARIADTSQSGLDWGALLGMAEHHGVLSLLAQNLPLHGNVPPAIQQSLAASFERNAQRSLWFAGELARITECFQQKNVHAIPYKGPLLAEMSYGDLALRSFGDLDFLVSPFGYQPAKQVLAELGYQPSQVHTPEMERRALATDYEQSFDRAAGKYLVELQWRLLPRFYAVDLETGDLLRRSRTALLAGRQMPCLAPEDLLLALCVHSAKHLWMRLIWVCDIAETLRSQTMDHAQVLERARQLGIVRMLAVSFWLVRNLLRRPLPSGLESCVDDEPEIEILGASFAERLARGATYDFESTDYFRWILRLRERRTDQARYLARLILTPSPSDLESVNLPGVLSPFYRVIRLYRLTRRLLF